MGRLTKISNYVIGANIGMCFEYAFRVASDEVFIYPFIIGVLMSVSALIDIIRTKTFTKKQIKP